MAKYVIILGHGEGDGGTSSSIYGISERVHLEKLGNELRKVIEFYGLSKDFDLIDDINVYRRNDFVKTPQRYKGKNVIELHLNAFNGIASGGEIIFGAGLSPDEMDLRFEKMLREDFGFRRYIVSDYYQNPREAKRLGINYRLVEYCFIDNVDDAKRFYSHEYYIAKRTIETIVGKKLIDSDVPPFTTNYIIQLGAFNDYNKAQEELIKIRKDYPSAWIRKVK